MATPCASQTDKFSAQVAALESEVRSLKADNASLAKDNKAGCSQIRAKDKELDAAAKQVAQAQQTDIQNKVGLLSAFLLAVASRLQPITYAPLVSGISMYR